MGESVSSARAQVDRLFQASGHSSVSRKMPEMTGDISHFKPDKQEIFERYAAKLDLVEHVEGAAGLIAPGGATGVSVLQKAGKLSPRIMQALKAKFKELNGLFGPVKAMGLKNKDGRTIGAVIQEMGQNGKPFWTVSHSSVGRATLTSSGRFTNGQSRGLLEQKLFETLKSDLSDTIRFTPDEYGWISHAPGFTF